MEDVAFPRIRDPPGWLARSIHVCNSESAMLKSHTLEHAHYIQAQLTYIQVTNVIITKLNSNKVQLTPHPLFSRSNPINIKPFWRSERVVVSQSSLVSNRALSAGLAGDCEFSLRVLSKGVRGGEASPPTVSLPPSPPPQKKEAKMCIIFWGGGHAPRPP